MIHNIDHRSYVFSKEEIKMIAKSLHKNHPRSVHKYLILTSQDLLDCGFGSSSVFWLMVGVMDLECNNRG